MASSLLPPCKRHLQPLLGLITLRCGGGSTKDFLKRETSFSYLYFYRPTYLELVGDLCRTWAGVSTSLFPRPLGTVRVCCQLTVGPQSHPGGGNTEVLIGIFNYSEEMVSTTFCPVCSFKTVKDNMTYIRGWVFQHL